MAFWARLAASIAVLALCGCGGGGGGGGGDDTGGGGGGGGGPPVLGVVPGVYLLPYFDAGTIKLLEPRLPVSATNPKTVDTLGTPYIDHAFLMGADWDGTHLSNWLPDRIVYLKNNQLFSVSLNTAGPNTPVQVSSIANACAIERTFDDYQDVADAMLAVWVKDGAGNCVDPRQYVMVKAGASAATPGVALGVNPYNNVQPLRNADGTLAGFLTYETPNVTRRDADFANPVTVLAAWDDGSGSYYGLSHANSNGTLAYFVSRAAADPAPTLYRYEIGTGTLTPVVSYPGMGGVPLFSIGALDADNYYFGSGGYTGAMYRVAHNSTTPVRMSSAAFTDELRYPRPTGSRVVVEAVFNGSSSSIYSLEKTAVDAAPTPIVTPGGGFSYVSSAHPNGTLLVTNSAVGGGSVIYKSWVAKDDGAILDYTPDSVWSGAIYDGPWNAYTSPVTRFIRLAYSSSCFTQPRKLYDASTGTQITTIAGIAGAQNCPIPFAFGKYMGFDLYMSRGIPKDYDAFVYETTAGTQALPVLTQSGVDEISLTRD